MAFTLTTPRLLLRPWQESDRQPFRDLNADPRVMEFFPAPLTPQASDELFDRVHQHFARHGYGPFAAELVETHTFIGFIGLSIPAFDAPFMPAVEIGWRLAVDTWGQGLATEGARAVLDYGFNELELPAIVSFTTATNLRSRHVMEKLGMTYNPADDFDHPAIPEGHPQRPHVLYRLTRAQRQSPL